MPQRGNSNNTGQRPVKYGINKYFSALKGRKQFTMPQLLPKADALTGLRISFLTLHRALPCTSDNALSGQNEIIQNFLSKNFL